MERIIALRPCRFGGVNYRKGDEIPETAVHSNRVKALNVLGFIKTHEVTEKAPIELESKEEKRISPVKLRNRKVREGDANV